jgi:carboxyl-terminal processing protease
MEEYLKFINQSDQAVQKALEVLQKEESFPKAPEQKLEVTNDEGTKETIA